MARLTRRRRTKVSFYEQFKIELDKVKILGDAPAAAVVGECLRAAKRAQMVVDGEEVSPGPFVIEA